MNGQKSIELSLSFILRFPDLKLSKKIVVRHRPCIGRGFLNDLTHVKILHCLMCYLWVFMWLLWPSLIQKNLWVRLLCLFLPSSYPKPQSPTTHLLGRDGETSINLERNRVGGLFILPSILWRTVTRVIISFLYTFVDGLMDRVPFTRHNEGKEVLHKRGLNKNISYTNDLVHGDLSLN